MLIVDTGVLVAAADRTDPHYERYTFGEVGSKTGDWRTVPVPQPVMVAFTQ